MIRSLIVIGLAGSLLLPATAFAARSDVRLAMPQFMSQRESASSLRTLPPTPVATYRPITSLPSPAPVTSLPLSRQLTSETESCSILWTTWWGRYSNAKLTNISSASDTMRGIARFASSYKAGNGLTVMVRLPVMVPSNTATVFIDGAETPRDPDNMTSCVSRFVDLAQPTNLRLSRIP